MVTENHSGAASWSQRH